MSNSGRPRNYPLRSLTENLFQRSGCRRISDGNAGAVLGYFEMASSTLNGAREWSSKRYIFGKNVRLFVKSLALNILIEGEKAKGIVMRDQYGQEHELFATKEVILSAGCHGSAKLLMTRYDNRGVLVLEAANFSWL